MHIRQQQKTSIIMKVKLQSSQQIKVSKVYIIQIMNSQQSTQEQISSKRRIIDQYPLLIQKIQCKICFERFNAYQKRPNFSCNNRHLICNQCLRKIVLKFVKNKQLPVCPLCRSNINIPPDEDLELKQLIKYINVVENTISSSDKRQAQLQLINLRNIKMIMQKDKKIEQQNKKIYSLERELMIVKEDTKELRAKKGNHIISFNYNSDSQSEKHQETKDIQIDTRKLTKKQSLKLVFEDLIDQKIFVLANKSFTKDQISLIISLDTTKIQVLTLSFNLIANQGLRLLCEQADMPSLKQLRVSNNNISELPSLKKVCLLQLFDMGNFQKSVYKQPNVLREGNIQKLLNQHWPNLTNLGIQFTTDRVWDQEQNQEQIVSQMPALKTLIITQIASKMNKTKCKNLTTVLNHKAKRLENNKIKVFNSN